MGLSLSSITDIFKFISGDLGFLLAFFIVIMGFSWYTGRGFIVSLIISFYPAIMMYKTFPFLDKLLFLNDSPGLLVTNKIAIFLLFLVPITIVINRFIFTASDYGGGENLLRLAGLSLTFLLLIVLFSYNAVNYDPLHDFSPQIDNLFSIEERQFYWFLAPIALLAIL